MTEYDFVVVQMTKINECVLQFFHLNGESIVMWKNRKDKCIDFCHLHVNKIISVINLIHTRHQRNNNGMYLFWNFLSEIQFSMITRDQNGSC